MHLYIRDFFNLHFQLNFFSKRKLIICFHQSLCMLMHYSSPTNKQPGAEINKMLPEVNNMSTCRFKDEKHLEVANTNWLKTY